MTSEQEQEKKIIHSFADEMHHFYMWIEDEHVSEQAFTYWFVKQMIRLFGLLQKPYQLDLLTEKSSRFVHERFYIHKGCAPKTTKFRKMLEKFVKEY